jgi:Mn-dependent DtxR family transcriptional regulator
MTKLAPALRETLSLVQNWTEDQPPTNARIAEALGISWRAAYDRTRKLRKLGFLHSCPNWMTVNGEGMAAYRDENGRMRSWLEFFIPESSPAEPDLFQSIFDPRR